MSMNPPAPPEEESLGALVAQATDQISTLVRSEIELAKAELKFDAKRVGTAAGLFAAAAFIAHLCLILASFAVAYLLVAVLGWSEWLAFAVVTLVYLLVAALMVLIGIRRLKGLTGMRRTARSLKSLKGSGAEEAAALPSAAPSSPGETGAHRAPVPSSQSPGR
jgi:hypothetical protein